MEVLMNWHFLTQTVLFRGCSSEEIQQMANFLRFRTAVFEEGAVILREGTIVTEIGLVLSGTVQLEYHDILGNKMILGMAEAGEVFAESYACIPEEPLMIDAVAETDCEILFFSVPKLFSAPLFPAQSRLMQNLLLLSARKNIQLSRRSLHTAPKTIRGRLISYFSQQMSVQGSSQIEIPFDRQQLADYLNLDRSALSKELGKMKREGLLEYRKNCFTLKLPLE